MISSRKKAFERDWTQGSIVNNLVRLSWPVVVTGILNQIDLLLDVVWVARLGATPLAAVGVATYLLMVVGMIRMGFTVSERAMISRAVGAGDIKSANHILSQTFLLNVIYSIVVILVGVFLAEPLMLLMGVEPEVAIAGKTYLQVAIIARAAMAFRMMGEACMQASGDTVTPMKIIVAMRVFGLIATPVLVFGLWVFPRWEVFGAGVANALTHFVGAVPVMWVLISGRTRLRLHLTWKPDFRTLWEMLKIGAPASINGAERSVLRVIITGIVATQGTYALAAYTIAMRVDMLHELFSTGLGQGSGILVGQNLGAGQPDRAYRSAWVAMGFSALTSVIIAILILLQAENIIRIFNPDPELVRIAAPYVRILMAGALFMSAALIFSQSLNGAGDTIPVLIISTIALYGVEIPLAFTLPGFTGWGFYGIAVAHTIGLATRSVLCISYFQSGKWKRKKIKIRSDGQEQELGRTSDK